MSIDALKQALADRDFREMIRTREMAEHEWATRVAVATQEGRQEGRQEGEQEKARQIALKMRARGDTPDAIFELTGLRPDQY